MFRSMFYLIILCQGIYSAAHQTWSSDAVADMAGVNTHFYCGNTAYMNNFDTLKSILIELGIRLQTDQ